MFCKWEDYLLSEKALDVQISLFILCILIGLINDIFFDSSVIGAIAMTLLISIVIIDVLLTSFIIIYNDFFNKKGDK